jgi:hypothetical protein
MQVVGPTVVGRVADRKDEFAELLRPALHRAAQLGLSPDQIRKVLDAELAQQPSGKPLTEGTRR